MAGNQSEAPNCEHFNATNSTSHVDKFAISTSCALFDFVIYTIAMGTLAVLGILGNAVSFIVLLRDRGRSATSFLLQALAVADTLVLVAAVPLYIVPPVYPFTGRLAGYYTTYMSLLPVLWPIYLMPDILTDLDNEINRKCHLPHAGTVQVQFNNYFCVQISKCSRHITSQ